MIPIARLVPLALITVGCAGGPHTTPRPLATGPQPGGSNSGPGQPSAPGPSGPTGTVEVFATGFRNNEGQVLIAVFASEAGFPDRGRFAAKRLIATIDNQRATARFENLPAGEYAISILHDENGNFEMDTGLFGIPKEGYGASNDARGRFGPPSWEDARFVIGADATVTQKIRITYP